MSRFVVPLPNDALESRAPCRAPESREKTRKQRAMAARYPIWKSLLKDKLSKLAVRRYSYATRRELHRIVAKEFMQSLGDQFMQFT